MLTTKTMNDSENKKDNLSTMIGDNKEWDKIKKEALKCSLLCRNCHALNHIDISKTERLSELITNIKRFKL